MTTEASKAAWIKASHHALGFTDETARRFFRVKSSRTVRGWWAGQRNGKPAEIPGPVVVLTEALMESLAVRRYFGLSLAGDPEADA